MFWQLLANSLIRTPAVMSRSLPGLAGVCLKAQVFVRSWGDDHAGVDGDSLLFRAASPSLGAVIRSVTR